MHRDYYRVDVNTREFIQQMLFLDYIEEASQHTTTSRINSLAYEALINDLAYYIQEEEYEMAGLLTATLKRFKGSLER